MAARNEVETRPRSEVETRPQGNKAATRRNGVTKRGGDDARGRNRQHAREAGAAALIAICLGYFMTILDTTIVNVALPSIGRDLGAAVAGLQWVVDGYALVFAGLLLTGGALGDRLGSRGVFLAGLALFTLTSALCAVAPTLWTLVAFRVAQGLGAALLVPTSLALLRHSYADAGGRARAIGLWGGIAGIAAAGGPVLGGVLVAALGWRGVFLVNIPVGLLGAWLTRRYVAPAPRLRGRGLDLPAQAAAVAALGALTFGVIEGGAWGWTSPLILGAFGLGAVATALFVAVERHKSDPMLPLGLFAAPAFSAATAVGFALNFGFYGQLFVMSLYLQQVRGYSPLLTGLALLPETGMAVVASTISGRLTARTGPRPPMLTGLALGGAGLLLLATVGPTTSYPVVGAIFVAVGFGMALTMPAATTAVMEEAPSERAGIASAVLNAARQVGGVLGVALLGALVGRDSSFVPGMHAAMLVAGAAFLGDCALTLRAIPRRP